MESWDIVQIVFIIVAGALTFWISTLQWRTNRDKLRFDIYRNRLKAYDAIEKLLFLHQQKGNLKFDEITEFAINTGEALWLFEGKAKDYIKNLLDHVRKLNFWYRQHDALGDKKENERKKLLKEKIKPREVEMMNALEGKSREEMFKPYLDFSNIRKFKWSSLLSLLGRGGGRT